MGNITKYYILHFTSSDSKLVLFNRIQLLKAVKDRNEELHSQMVSKDLVRHKEGFSFASSALLTPVPKHLVKLAGNSFDEQHKSNRTNAIRTACGVPGGTS